MTTSENNNLLNNLADLLEKNKLDIAKANTEDVLTSLQTNVENIERGIASLRAYVGINLSHTSELSGGVSAYSCYGDPSFSLFGMVLAPAIKLGGNNAHILIGFPSILKKYGLCLEKLISNSDLLPNLSFCYGTKNFMSKTLSMTTIKHCVVFGDKWVYKYIDEFKKIKSLTYYGPGNNTAVILSDINIEQAIDKILESAFILSGQVAVSINRCIIDNRIDKVKVAALFYDKLMKITCGEDPSNYVTPIIPPYLIEQLEQRVSEAEKKDSIITNYSVNKNEKSTLISPSLIWLHNTDSNIWKDYHFAPVLPIVFLDFNEIAKEINNTNYGIYTTLWGAEEEIDQLTPEILKEHIMVLKNKSILDIITTENGYIGTWGGYKNSGFTLSKETNWEAKSGSFSLLETFTK